MLFEIRLFYFGLKHKKIRNKYFIEIQNKNLIMYCLILQKLLLIKKKLQTQVYKNDIFCLLQNKVIKTQHNEKLKSLNLNKNT
jgi:hypothetical protein